MRETREHYELRVERRTQVLADDEIREAPQDHVAIHFGRVRFEVRTRHVVLLGIALGVVLALLAVVLLL